MNIVLKKTEISAFRVSQVPPGKVFMYSKIPFMRIDDPSMSIKPRANVTWFVNLEDGTLVFFQNESASHSESRILEDATFTASL